MYLRLCRSVPRVIAGYHAARMFRTLKGSSWKNAAALVSGWVKSGGHLLASVAGSTRNTLIISKNNVMCDPMITILQ